MEINSTSVQFTIKDEYVHRNKGKVIVKITKEEWFRKQNMIWLKRSE